MNIEGPSLKDLHERGIYALRQFSARAAAAGYFLPATSAPHNAADLIEEGMQPTTERKLDRDVAA